MNKKGLSSFQIVLIIVAFLLFLYFFTGFRIVVPEGSFLDKLAGIFK